MSQVKYTAESEWLRIEGDDVVTVGITDFAQESLGDLVFVQLPAVGAKFAAGDEVAVIESVKAASEINMPVAGVVTEINQAVADAPGQINKDPMGSGWFFKMKVNNMTDLNSLMDEAAYKALVAKEKD